MFYSRERQGTLAVKLIEGMKKDDRVVWEEDPQTVRRAVTRLLSECEKAEEQLRLQAEQKVSQLKRNVPAGSGEWEILVRRYLDAEYERLERFRVSLDKS